MNILLLLVGIMSGSTGVFIFSPTLIAVAVILITTPLILEIVNNMLIERWSQVIIIFFLVTGYISVSVWALNLFLNTASFQDRLEPSIVINGAGFVQLVWIFLVAVGPEPSSTPPRTIYTKYTLGVEATSHF